MTLEESEYLDTFSDDEFLQIHKDPVNFDLFYYGVWDYWYQQPVLRDTWDSIAAVFGRQSGKSDIIARRENYNGATNTIDDLAALLVAPAQRQSENLFKRCEKYINRSPILLSQLKRGRVLMKGIEWENGYTIVNMPIGQSADKVRGFTIDELVFEEAAFVPGAAYDALVDSLLSTAGTEIRIGTPFGKANPLYFAFEKAFQINTIPDNRWEAWDITEKDQILREIKIEDKDLGWSCHHYPSHVGLNVYKEFKVYIEEAWEINMKKDQRFSKIHKGWLVIKTEQKQFIGKLLTDYDFIIKKLPEQLSFQYKNVKELLDDPLHCVVALPQINPKRLKKNLDRPRNVVERENLALFSDEDGVVFPYQLVVRAFQKGISLWDQPRKGWSYYGGLDIAKGVGGDYTVITVVAYKKPKIQLVYQWSTNKRRIKDAEKTLINVHGWWGVEKWYVDSNTIGARSLEELEDILGSNFVDGIGFQVKDKAELVANMESLLGTEQTPCNIAIPEEMTELKHQMMMYQKELSQDNRTLKYSHPDWEGEHDDELDSLMLACLCARVEETEDLDIYFVPRIY